MGFDWPFERYRGIELTRSLRTYLAPTGEFLLDELDLTAPISTCHWISNGDGRVESTDS